MGRDPVVEEVRRIRDTIAKEHGYSVAAIAGSLRRQEAEAGRKLTALPPKRLPAQRPERKAG